LNAARGGRAYTGARADRLRPHRGPRARALGRFPDAPGQADRAPRRCAGAAAAHDVRGATEKWTPLSVAVRVPVLVEPMQQRADAARREGDARICGAVVEIDRVAVGVERVAAGERDVAHVPLALVQSLGTEDPRIATRETAFRVLQCEQRNAEAVKTPSGRLPHAVVEHQPPTRCFDQRRGEPDLVRVPPTAL